MKTIERLPLGDPSSLMSIALRPVNFSNSSSGFPIVADPAMIWGVLWYQAQSRSNRRSTKAT